MWTTAANDARRPLVRLTRRYRFSASHRLHSPALSDDENRSVYGKCNNPYGHGHDYVMDITIRGEMDPLLGRLMSVEQLDGFVRRTILEPMGHRDLNSEVPEFATLVPTTENLARVAASRLASAWPIAFPGSTALPEKVRIWETKRNIFELFVHAPGFNDVEDHQLAGLTEESK